MLVTSTPVTDCVCLVPAWHGLVIEKLLHVSSLKASEEIISVYAIDFKKISCCYVTGAWIQQNIAGTSSLVEVLCTHNWNRGTDKVKNHARVGCNNW